MSTIVKNAENQLKSLLADALSKAIAAGELPQGELPAYTIEVPADRTHGDLATNAAMISAKALRCAPRKIADALVANMDLKNTYFDKVEVAGPGFINFFLSAAYYGDVVTDAIAQGDAYGRSDFGNGKKVMVEYVSANPTGPMHMGNARGGALGDCLASVLDAAGYAVWREFYINDAGNQIEKFGLSLEVRYLQHLLGEDQVELPEDAYHGDDIKEHAANFAKKFGDKYVNADKSDRSHVVL